VAGQQQLPLYHVKGFLGRSRGIHHACPPAYGTCALLSTISPPCRQDPPFFPLQARWPFSPPINSCRELKTRLQVTLPRLKAIITGDIPGFLDIVANFNSKEMAQDNIISRARAAGKKVTMFGDETWLKLFPNSFHRSDGTTAFYVMDTRIVDDNVTRHVLPELEEDDWDMMVLHYLGLDHAGHVSGAESALMRSKQAEMDDLVRMIHGKLSQQAAGGGRRTALVVASDHGMNAQGNHGGATNDER
jgi:hypothetical protein